MLNEIDMRPFGQLTAVGDYFLSDCTSLEDLKLPTSLQSTGDYFLNDCI
ncbi:MAG: hypothetical protein HUJ68_11060 [Clostridia bacterium]|nr:hypothetical protein [Clostridia bacterium]